MSSNAETRPPRPPSALELVAALSADAMPLAQPMPANYPVVKAPLVVRVFVVAIVALIGLMALLSSYASRSIDGLVGAIADRNVSRRHITDLQIPTDQVLLNDKIFNSMLREQPHNACGLWRGRASALVAQDRLEEALTAYVMVRRYAEGKLPAVDGLAHAGVLMKLERHDEALSIIALVDMAQLPDELRARAIAMLARCYHIKEATIPTGSAPSPLLAFVDENPFLAPKEEYQRLAATIDQEKLRAITQPARPRDWVEKTVAGTDIVLKPLPKKPKLPTLNVTVPDSAKPVKMPQLSVTIPDSPSVPDSAEPATAKALPNLSVTVPESAKPMKVPQLSVTVPEVAQADVRIPPRMTVEEAAKLVKTKGTPKYARPPQLSVTMPDPADRIPVDVAARDLSKPHPATKPMPKLSVTVPHPDQHLPLLMPAKVEPSVEPAPAKPAPPKPTLAILSSTLNVNLPDRSQELKFPTDPSTYPDDECRKKETVAKPAAAPRTGLPAISVSLPNQDEMTFPPPDKAPAPSARRPETTPPPATSLPKFAKPAPSTAPAVPPAERQPAHPPEPVQPQEPGTKKLKKLSLKDYQEP
jgi:hypothetical protein